MDEAYSGGRYTPMTGKSKSLVFKRFEKHLPHLAQEETPTVFSFTSLEANQFRVTDDSYMTLNMML